MNLLQGFDLFGVRPIWYIGGQKKNTTANGYLFSFGIISFALWVLILLSHDLFNRANPQVTRSTQQGVTLANPIYLDLKGFQFMYALLDSDNKFVYNESIFTIEGNVIFNNYTTKSLRMKNCSLSDIENIVPYQGPIICFDPDQEILYDGVNAFVEAKFKACVNSTENNFRCAPQSEIDDTLKGYLVFIFFPIYSILPANYNNPFQINWNFLSYTVDPFKTKVLNTLFKFTELKTDDGWLITTTSSILQMVYDQILFDIGNQEYYDCFIEFQMWTLGDLDIIYRRFPKLQDFLAQVFGLIQFILLGLSIVFVPYARYKMYEYIGNHIYDLNIDQKKRKKRTHRLARFQKNISRQEEFATPPPGTIGSTGISSFPDFDHPIQIPDKSNKFKGPMNLLTVNTTDMGPPQTEVFTDFSTGVDNVTYVPRINRFSGSKLSRFRMSNWKFCCKRKASQEPKLKYHLTFFEFFLSLCRNSPKKILLERVENEIIKNLDILSFSKRMVEFELLKNYLLSENQQSLFNNLPRPKINLRIATDKKYFSYNKTPPYTFRIDSVLKSNKKKDDEIANIIDDMQKHDMNTIDLRLLSRFKVFIKTNIDNNVEESS